MASLTILMSTYNRREFLPTALESIRRQTFTDWRLLVVNDGGEDVGDLISNYGDVRIEYFNRPHLGKAAQLNFALGLVDSKYVGYMDDDDEALPGHWEGLCKAAELTGSEFVYSNVQPLVVGADGEVLQKWPVDDRDIEWDDIRLHNAINHSTVLHTRALADRVGKYDERMRVLIDYDYIKRLAKAVRPVHVHEATYLWKLRMSGEGQIQSISGLWERDPVTAGQSVLALFEKDPGGIAACYREHATLGGIRSERDALRDACSALSSERDVLRTDRDRLQADCYRLQDEKGRLTADRDQLRLERDQTAADRDGLRTSYADLFGELENLRVERDGLKNEYLRVVNSRFWRKTGFIRRGLRFAKRLVLAPRKFLGGLCRRFMRTKPLRAYMHVPEAELTRQRATTFAHGAKISILVPLYNTQEVFLREMIGSVQAQTYSNWELCLVDGSDGDHADVEAGVRRLAAGDSRIRYERLAANLGIAGNTNAALAMATGDYVALFDHDDVLHPSALFEIATAIEREGADFVYTDEAVFSRVGGRETVNLSLKPDFSPSLLRGVNFICHFTVFRRSLLDGVGAFDSACDGSQDHDLVLRLTEKASHVVHVRKILYFWRVHPGSTSYDPSVKSYASTGGVRAIERSLERRGLQGEVSALDGHPTLYRTRLALDTSKRVVVFVLAHGHARGEVLTTVASVATRTHYPNYEISLLDAKAAGLFEAVSAAKGEYVVFLDAGCEVQSPEWLEEMLMFARLRDVGAVGGRVMYANGYVRHAGLVVDPVRGVGLAHCGCQPGHVGDFFRLLLPADYRAVSPDCMMVRRDLFLEAGGFNGGFSPFLSGVDFCLRLGERGLRSICTPFAVFARHVGVELCGVVPGEEHGFWKKWAGKLGGGDPFATGSLLGMTTFILGGEGRTRA